MKKQIGLFTAILFAVSTLMVSCSPEVHEHTFAEEWSSDETAHWHAATCECSDVELQKTEHTFGDWTITKEPTEEAEGSKEKSCSVCEYKVTEEIAKVEHTHTFGEWKVTKEATEEAEGCKERVCDVCKYKETAEIAQLNHKHVAGESWKNDDKNHWKECTGCKEKIDVKGHSYSETWKKDASIHWKECVCGAKKDEAEHNFGTWNITTKPTTNAQGKGERSCSYCGYVDAVVLQPVPKGFVFVKGTTITGTESWTPSSDVFVSGRILPIPNLYVSDHEVTRGEYKDVMGSDPSRARAYDKDGNELEGDAVLNYPVNWVSWYDAIVYCNKLSKKEDLTPCYSIDGSTDPEHWGAVPIKWDDPLRETWDVATCNWNANGYRLPTEAEWEWLARGGENYTYAGSDTIDDVAWYVYNTEPIFGTREVKTKASNGYGLYDMSGNVYEWCWDWYDSISDSTASDGTTSGSDRVIRGGSWLGIAGRASVCSRIGKGPNLCGSELGFRVVRNAK